MGIHQWSLSNLPLLFFCKTEEIFIAPVPKHLGNMTQCGLEFLPLLQEAVKTAAPVKQCWFSPGWCKHSVQGLGLEWSVAGAHESWIKRNGAKRLFWGNIYAETKIKPEVKNEQLPQKKRTLV